MNLQTKEKCEQWIRFFLNEKYYTVSYRGGVFDFVDENGKVLDFEFIFNSDGKLGLEEIDKFISRLVDHYHFTMSQEKDLTGFISSIILFNLN